SVTARRTESVGVPSTAKRRRDSLRIRSGRRSVSEWLEALCSSSGATTHTSFDRDRATFSRCFRPGAWMPSSFDSRMRALERSSGSLSIRSDPRRTEVRSQRLRDGHGSVRLLAVLQERDQRTTDGQGRAVQRMHEARALLALAAAAGAHAPRLKLAAGRAAGYLTIGPLPRQPYLDVEGPPGGKADVAGAEIDDPIRQLEPLQDGLGHARHPLLLGV